MTSDFFLFIPLPLIFFSFHYSLSPFFVIFALTMEERQIIQLYIKWCGHEPQAIEKLPGAGSNRSYYRLTGSDGKTAIGVAGTSTEENAAFVYLSRHFRSKGLPMPEVYAVSDDNRYYLQEDLGHTSLFDAIRNGREAGGKYSKDEEALLSATIRLLPAIQVKGAEELDFSICYPQPEFDKTNVMFDLNYFKYCFLKATNVDFHEMRLEEDFQKLAEDLISYEQQTATFMYRDFQARNVMISVEGGLPSFIDFQGGRRGPLYYDVASFLWQASARYTDELRQRLIDEYYDELKTLTAVPEKAMFIERLALFVFFRMLQVLGAYGFRGYFERKKHFIDSIPPAIDNLRELLEKHHFPYPHLVETLNAVISRSSAKEIIQANKRQPSTDTPNLVVRIFSFSYKKGIPDDESGNGGGYVFDCRSTHNPGRYEPYKKLTGLDEPVIRFLEDDGEILTFLESIYKLADAHVARYIERDFTSLMFSFGCTGGQHRSVYSAQHLAEHIHEKFGIEVRLCHREQGITQVFEAKR